MNRKMRRHPISLFLPVFENPKKRNVVKNSRKSTYVVHKQKRKGRIRV